MKKSIYALFYLLLSLSPLLAQNEEALELTKERLTTLESQLLKVEGVFADAQDREPASSSLSEIRKLISAGNSLLEKAKDQQSTLLQRQAQLVKSKASPSQLAQQEEELQIDITSFSNSLIDIEEKLRQAEIYLKEHSQDKQSEEGKTPIGLDIFTYTYQESENGYSLEISLPDIQSPEKLRSLTQTWMDLANKEMERVKESGRKWNKEKPGAPQYLYLCSYEQYYNSLLDVTSLVTSFYEYVGDFPGTEKVQALVIRRDLNPIKVSEVFTPKQMTYVQKELNRQLKQDVARREDDMEKKHLEGSSVDLNKATLYFSEENLEVCFPTGVLNSRLGRAACFSIPVREILKH